MTNTGKVTGKMERQTANWLNKARVVKISPEVNIDSLSSPVCIPIMMLAIKMVEILAKNVIPDQQYESIFK